MKTDTTLDEHLRFLASKKFTEGFLLGILFTMGLWAIVVGVTP